MSKKTTTIGLSPLEEYLSAPKSSSTIADKKAESEKASKSQKIKDVEPKEPLVLEVVQQAAQPPIEFGEAVEIDGQGQLAIKGTRVPEEKLVRAPKQRITLHISTELVDRVKNAVYWEPGLTVAGFAEEAFALAIEALEKERGAAFPQRKQHRLRGGRPVS